MKRRYQLTMTLLLLFGLNLSAQKKEKNGTIYKTHPGIDLVHQYQQAFVSGDEATLTKILADDAKSINALSSNKDDKGSDKSKIIGNAKTWSENIDYLRITDDKPAYPDAIEYKEGGQLWVQTWEKIYGVQKKTGVKLDMPVHRLYKLNNEGTQIESIFDYADWRVYEEIWNSFSDRENGTIYINHENINSVRKSVHAFENGELEKSYAYFSDDATVSDINLPYGTRLSWDEAKANDQAFLKTWEIESIDRVGYPDYLEYDLRDLSYVLSWWKFRLIRKSDGKKLTLPVHFIDDFNKEGKIMGRSLYYSAKLMEDLK